MQSQSSLSGNGVLLSPGISKVPFVVIFLKSGYSSSILSISIPAVDSVVSAVVSAARAGMTMPDANTTQNKKAINFFISIPPLSTKTSV